ncbi:MAG: hypothetical protein ACE5KP_05120 [Dehalococcoidales bacterium]
MTHSLHRQGTKENLSRDFPLVAVMAHGFNEKGGGPKLGKFLEICWKHGPSNLGDMKQGSVFTHDAEKIYKNVSDTTIVECVFDDLNKVEAVLRELKEADLGVPVVVSGLTDTVRQCCQKVGLEIHTVAQSLGVWGNTSRLPSKEVLEITTMCGHAMVSSNLVEMMIEDVKKGAITPEKAAEKLAKPCECGIFNPTRASELLAKAAGK